MEAVTLRHNLHRFPCVAGDEKDTADRIAKFLADSGIHITRDIGGHGILARVGPLGPGPLLRCELDALPLAESSGVEHTSERAGLHHACGHDGHMAMLAGALIKMPSDRTVYALFQPAEETGEGMLRCLDDLDIEVTKTFALHNVPGVPVGTIEVREGIAAMASTGLRIRLEGRRSHASEPEKGANPIPLAAAVVLAMRDAPRVPGAKSALVEIQGGGPTYGTSAGDAMVGATMRAELDEDLQAMIQSVLKAAANESGIQSSHELIEPFPACGNDSASVQLVTEAAQVAGFTVVNPDSPYPWSEDFGYALKRWPGALFGLGSGDAAPLHDSHYDFPDVLIERGIALWLAIAEAAS